MCRMMFGLREIRSSIESLPIEARPEPPPTTFSIIAVPSGHEIGANGGFTPMMPLMIEHDPQPPLRVDERIVEPEQDAEPRLTALESKLLEMGHEQLLELARSLHVGE